MINNHILISKLLSYQIDIIIFLSGWKFRLFPGFDYYKQYCGEHLMHKIYCSHIYNLFFRIPRSEISELEWARFYGSGCSCQTAFQKEYKS